MTNLEVSPLVMAPAEPVVMRPVWKQLLFLHWAVDPEQLQKMLPPGLELDLFDGRAYVGLVPFTMIGVRPRWGPPWRRLTDFHETNVRTYVTRGGQAPGVWFFSLDAASASAVCAARLWFKLPYFAARMRLELHGDRIDYSSQRLWPSPLPADLDVSYTPGGIAAPASSGTLEHFLIERYLLYSYARGRLFSGRVYHAPYQIRSAELHSLTEGLIEAAGIERGNEQPIVHYAESVETQIFKLQPCG